MESGLASPTVQRDDVHRPTAAAEVRPKILVLGPFQPPDVACGISAAVRAFAASRVRDHYDIALISTFRPQRERRLLERLAFGVWLATRTVFQVVRSGALLVDIHAASGRSLLSHAAILFGARLAGRPALLRIHGGEFQWVFEQSNRFHRALIRFILRSATRVVVLSEGWRGRLEAIEPRAAIEVIPNSVDFRGFDDLALRPARERRRILFLGNFCESKGHFDALEAIGNLAARYPDLVLALAGEDRDPGTRQRLEREADRLAIRRQVEFLGVVSGPSKDKALRDADILILPSHTENMPVSVIEGMAAALPVVATAVGAVSEMIRDGETGLLIEPRRPDLLAQCLERLLNDAQLACTMARNAQRHARANWDADLVAERNLVLYASLTAAPRSGYSSE